MPWEDESPANTKTQSCTYVCYLSVASYNHGSPGFGFGVQHQPRPSSPHERNLVLPTLSKQVSFTPTTKTQTGAREASQNGRVAHHNRASHASMPLSSNFDIISRLQRHPPPLTAEPSPMLLSPKPTLPKLLNLLCRFTCRPTLAALQA